MRACASSDNSCYVRYHIQHAAGKLILKACVLGQYRPTAARADGRAAATVPNSTTNQLLGSGAWII